VLAGLIFLGVTVQALEVTVPRPDGSGAFAITGFKAGGVLDVVATAGVEPPVDPERVAVQNGVDRRVFLLGTAVTGIWLAASAVWMWGLGAPAVYVVGPLAIAALLAISSPIRTRYADFFASWRSGARQLLNRPRRVKSGDETTRPAAAKPKGG
jgi:hypothetical protein